MDDLDDRPGFAGTFHDAVSALAVVPTDTRSEILALPPDPAAHADAFARVAAFRQVEVGGRATAAPGAALRVAAWNLERCLYPEAVARVLRRHGADVALLTEMDAGMHRTGQRHTTQAVAEALGHGYGYAAEFLELVAMPAPIAFPGNPPGNRLGFHGNGFTAALPFRDPAVIRLDMVADWFVSPQGGQRRVGNRMAVAAVFAHGGRPFDGCSVHLESATDFAGRARQFQTLLDAIDACAPGLPVVIGGDLNTAVEAAGARDPRETLLALAEARGYDWSACNDATPTTRRSVWSDGAGTRRLDWFCTRGLRATAPQVVPALDEAGTVLSDHDLLLVTLAFA